MQKPYSPWPLTWIPVEGFIFVEHHLLPSDGLIGQPNIKELLRINVIPSCSITTVNYEIRKFDSPKYVWPRSLNGNTQGFLGFGLSEVVWHDFGCTLLSGLTSMGS